MSILRRPPRVLVAAVQTLAIYDLGSKPIYAARADRTPVLQNRMRRDTSRAGWVHAKRAGSRFTTTGGDAPDSLTPAGFGPFGPVVIGASIVFRGPKVTRTRSRLLTDPQRIGVFSPKRHLGNRFGTLAPTLIGAPLGTTFGGPRRYLTYSVRKRGVAILHPPTVLATPVVFTGPKVNDTYSRRGRPKSKLSYTAVFNDAPQVAYPRVKLARTPLRPALTRRLGPPTVVTQVATAIYFGPSVHLVRSPKPRTRSQLLPVPAAFQPVGQLKTHLAPSSRGKAKSRLSLTAIIDLTPQVYVVATTLATIKHPPVRYFLRPPADTVGLEDQGKVATHLAYSRRGAPKSRLTPPTVLQAGAVYYGPAVHLTRGRAGRVRSLLLPVPSAFQPVGTLQVALAPQRRGTPKSRLSLTAIIDLRPQTYFIQTQLVTIKHPPVEHFLRPPTDVFDEQDKGTIATTLAYSLRGKPKSVLRPPVVVFLAVELSGPQTKLAYSLRGKAKSHLFQPTDLVDQQDVGQVKTHLTYSRRGAPKSRLAPPTVVFLAVEIYGPEVTLARITPPPTISRLSPPTDLVDAQDLGRVVTHLAYSLRGRPKSRLSLTAIIDLRPQVYTIATALATIKHPPVESKLRPPTRVLSDADKGVIKTTFARIKHPPVQSVLRKPTDLVDEQDKGYVQVTLAPSFRGKPKPRLALPTVIDLSPQAYYLTTWLTYSRRGTPKSRLFPAILAYAQPKAEQVIKVTLVRGKRGRPDSTLRPPVVITGATVYRGLAVYLTRQTRPVAKSRLQPPTVVNSATPAAIYYGPAVHLTRGRAGTPKSRLLPLPTIVQPTGQLQVTLAPQARRPGKARLLAVPAAFQPVGYLSVTLAPQSRRPGRALLRKPVVIDLRPQVYTVTTWLTYSLRGKPKSILRQPTDTAGLEDQGHLRVTFARIRPVHTLARLEPPTVIDNSPQVYYLATWLAYSRRGAPKSILRPPTDLVDQADVGQLRTHLAKIRPAQTHWRLWGPTVIGQGITYAPLAVTLTYSKRGRPMSILRGPSKFAPTPKAETTLTVWLAYSVRGKPKSILRPPRVIDVRPQTKYLRVYLARNKVKRTRYFLRPPARVAVARAETTLQVTLVRIRPARTSAFSTGVIYGAPLSRPIDTTLVRIRPQRTLGIFTGVIVPDEPVRPIAATLTYSLRGKPKSRLGQPAILRTGGRIKVTLAPQRRGRPTYFLRKPTAIDNSPQVAYLKVHLVRIRPAKTHPRLAPPAVTITICYGTVVGFDFAPEVCGYDTGAIVKGSVTAAVVTGTDSGALAQGATAPGGSVTGGDEKREGC